MNDAQPAPGASLLPDSTGLITGIHFALIALFAVAAIAIILVGIRRKRRRRRAEQVVEARIEHAEQAASTEPASAEAPPAPLSPPATEMAPARAAPASTPEPAPTPASTPEPVAAPAGDDPAAGPLGQLKGLGPKVTARLAELGITRVGQLAALSDADAAALDAQLGPFAGRMARDRWLEQARLLAAGDRAGFEAAFGRL